MDSKVSRELLLSFPVVSVKSRLRKSAFRSILPGNPALNGPVWTQKKARQTLQFTQGYLKTPPWLHEGTNIKTIKSQRVELMCLA